MRTSIPQILWCPDLRRYDVEIHTSYEALFRGDPNPPFTRSEGEYPIQIELTLYVDGVPHSRQLEAKVVVRKNGDVGIQSFSINLNRLYEGEDFLQDRPEIEGSGYLRCVLKGRDEDLNPLPEVPFWLHAQKQNCLFIYPASLMFGNPKASPHGLRSKFCEQFPAVVYEPDEDVTTALALINPQNRETRTAVRVFPPDLDGEKSEFKLRLPPHTARLLPLHECFALERRRRNSGVLVISDHKQVTFSVHMDLAGANVWSVDHTDPWRTRHFSGVPISLYLRRKFARVLGKVGMFNYHGH